MKQTNISVFIPHNGCPNRCSFCDQRYISGVNKPPPADEVRTLLSEQLPILSRNDMAAEIAFFGGSFTAIDRGYMVSLLEVAEEFVRNYPDRYNGIRCSTRPDCIDDDVLGILKRYGVTAIELGAQSMDDAVLSMNDRGHSSDDVRKASELIKSYGFSLGLQMMTGLYGDTPEKSLRTAEEFLKLCPDTVRIYPTVILSGTRLGELYENGTYKSFTFDETVSLCAELLGMFEKSGIAVIRLGLHASREVEERMLGGVYHPALREIVESRMFCNEMEKAMEALGGNRFSVYTDERNISKVLGHKKANKEYLNSIGKEFVIVKEKGTKLRVVPDTRG